jgi:hypothetical protein
MGTITQVPNISIACPSSFNIWHGYPQHHNFAASINKAVDGHCEQCGLSRKLNTNFCMKIPTVAGKRYEKHGGKYFGQPA